MFVLRRYDLNPNLVFLFSTYSEVTKSLPTEYNGKKAATLFLKSENSKKRAEKMGWIDETEEYHRHIEIEQKALEKTEKKKTTRKKRTTKK